MSSDETSEKSKQLATEQIASETRSTEPLEDLESDIVLDFLYHDARRIASFIAQFKVHGNPMGTKAVVGTTELGRTKSSGGLSGSIPFVGNARGDIGHDQEKGSKRDLERTFDPFWKNARELLDYLLSAGMVSEQIETARIGQFVLVSRHVAIVDMAVLQSAWKVKGFKLKILQGLIAATGAPTTGQAARQAKETHEEAFEFMQLLPHVIQCSINTGRENVWCSLDADYLITSATDILMKNGGAIPGVWKILGIIDTFPESKEAGEIRNSPSFGGMGEILGFLAPSIQMLMGRPNQSYGITPLLIFRDVLATDAAV